MKTTRLLLIGLFLIILNKPSFSQTTASFSASQSYNNDLQSGERNAFDVSANLSAKYMFPIFDFQNAFNYKICAGALFEKSDKTKKECVTPTENEFYFEDILKYPLNWNLDPYCSFNLRTSITEAIKFSGTKKIVSANFWDPVNTQESAGLAYGYKDSLSRLEVRVGLSLQQIRAEKYTSTTDDSKTRNVKEAYKAKKGLEYIITYSYTISTNTSLNCKLSVFGDLEDTKVWDVRWENELKVSIWKSVGVIIKLNLLYFDKQMSKLQVQQSTKLGVMGSF